MQTLSSRNCRILIFFSLLLSCISAITQESALKTYCVHPVFSCFYYEPCDLSARTLSFDSTAPLKIHKCPKGLVFSQEHQRCKWVNAWQSCLRIDLDMNLVRNFLLENATKAGTEQTTTKTTRIDTKMNKKQLDELKPRLLNVNNKSRNILQEISTFSSFMDKPGDYSFIVVPVKLAKSQSKRKGQASKIAPRQIEALRYKKVCYVTNWSQYRDGYGRFQPENIDPFLCTHVIYAFAYIDEVSLLLRSIEHNDLEMYKRINSLKALNPKLKTMLAVGGWNMGSEEFSKMVGQRHTRQRFISHAIKFIRQNNFDGIDLDWEFPADRGGTPEDKPNFTLFVRELRQSIDEESSDDKLILSAAVAAGKTRIDKGYEVEKFVNEVDFINLMAFDFHGSWGDSTGLNAALYGNEDDSNENAEYNQDWSVNYWISLGCPAHKIVLGMPAYGRSFKLLDFDSNGLYSRSEYNSGIAGDFTKTTGFLSFYEICQFEKKENWKKEWLPSNKVHYMYSNSDWISYDDIQSFRIKTAYVVSKKLGGQFIWSIDMDDFQGKVCGQGRYPLLRNSLNLLPEFMPFHVNEKKAKHLEIDDKEKETIAETSSVYFMKQSLEKPEFPLTISEEEIMKFDKIRSDLRGFLMDYPNNFLLLNSKVDDSLKGRS